MFYIVTAYCHSILSLLFTYLLRFWQHEKSPCFLSPYHYFSLLYCFSILSSLPLKSTSASPVPYWWPPNQANLRLRVLHFCETDWCQQMTPSQSTLSLSWFLKFTTLRRHDHHHYRHHSFRFRWFFAFICKQFRSYRTPDTPLLPEFSLLSLSLDVSGRVAHTPLHDCTFSDLHHSQHTRIH